MLLGLISDTHDHFDPRLPEIFAGVDHILHAGDVCSHKLLSQLEALAPVTAVLGNNDHGMNLPEIEVTELGGRRFLLQHIVRPDALTPALLGRMEAERPEVVLFGHSHQRFDEMRGGVRFINPGYAGRPRFNLKRTVAVFEIAPERMSVRFFELAPTHGGPGVAGHHLPGGR